MMDPDTVESVNSVASESRAGGGDDCGSPGQMQERDRSPRTLAFHDEDVASLLDHLARLIAGRHAHQSVRRVHPAADPSATGDDL